MTDPPIFVQVARRKQVFTFLLDPQTTVAAVKEKITSVAEQYEIPQAAEEALLLLENGTPTDAEATLASLQAETKATEGLSLHLVYAIGDNKYEPVEVEPTRPAA